MELAKLNKKLVLVPNVRESGIVEGNAKRNHGRRVIARIVEDQG